MALAGLAALSLSGCEKAVANAAPAGAPAGPPVTAAVVIEKPVTETQEFSGRLEAVERVDIRSRVSGFITQVNFKPGSLVKKGDLLFVIDPRPFQAEAARAEAAAVSARAKADLAKLELARAERLLADKAIAQREFDEKASGLKELDANARAAQATLEAARLNLASPGHSPISGRVSKAEVTTGNLVDGAVVLTSVVSNKPIYASFDGDEDTYLRVGACRTRARRSASRSAWPTKRASRTKASSNSSTTARRQHRQRAHARHLRERRTTRWCRACSHGSSWRRRSSRQESGPDQRPRRRHRPEPQVRVRGRRRQQGRIPRRHARSEHRRPARGAQRRQAGRENRRQRPAARASRRAGDAADRRHGWPPGDQAKRSQSRRRWPVETKE
jgi:RND family efflux transporter MFP subunit